VCVCVGLDAFAFIGNRCMLLGCYESCILLVIYTVDNFGREGKGNVHHLVAVASKMVPACLYLFCSSEVWTV
jgi:hypothetical protein